MPRSVRQGPGWGVRGRPGKALQRRRFEEPGRARGKKDSRQHSCQDGAMVMLVTEVWS